MKTEKPKTKPLTKAQRKNLIALNEDVMIANHNMNKFIAYLREEHEAPVEKYEMKDVMVGFVEIQQPEKQEENQKAEAKK